MFREPLFPFIWAGAALAADSPENYCSDVPMNGQETVQWVIKFLVFVGLPFAYREWDRRQESRKKDDV